MHTETIRPVILCGGSGTRLWPLSTADRPKQFLNLLGDETMLEMTLGRVSGVSGAGVDFASPMVIGGQGHEALIVEQAPGADVLLEPFGKNSAAPVAAASLASAPDDLLLILPADHDIRDVGAFHAALREGADAARAGDIVTFGIVPTMPATGYGYIEALPGDGAVRDAKRFVEKPDRETAERYLAAGGFFWNAGIFLFRAGDMLDAFRAHAPDILEAVTKALPEGGAAEAGKAGLLDPAAFDACRSESIDYAIMEHLGRLKVVPAEMGWSDIGDFKALWERSGKDKDGNVLIGDVRARDCRNCYIRSTGRPVSVAGQEDAVIIATGDDVMSCGMSAAQSVKALAKT